MPAGCPTARRSDVRTDSSDGDQSSRAIASVVIPAHNEERVIGRLLDALVSEDPATPIEIVVVCNGCADATAAVAAGYGDRVFVIDLPEPSKRKALRAGDKASTSYPRVYVDADVEISAESIQRLADAVRGTAFLASAPQRTIPRDGVGLLVRWYYDVWERLPQVRSGLFGRGVIALSEAGNQRIRDLPPMMADDLVVSEAFAAEERIVVDDAVVVVHPPRRLRDLHRRRVRSATGNAQTDAAGLRRAGSSTSISSLIHLVRAEPRLMIKMPVFVGVTAVAKLAARGAIRRGDFDTWLRDESSRSEV